MSVHRDGEVGNEPHPNTSLRHRVYYAARDGLHVTLYTLLADQATPQQKELLQSVTKDEDGQACPPLVIAARNGHDKAVHSLITKFGHGVAEGILDLDVTGTVVFEDYVIEGATALWCAAGAGQLKVLKTLLKAGADVNKVTESLSTPLRAACYEGHTEIVKYLIQKGNADVNVANKYDNTCLMIAAYRGHFEIVKLLLSHGADISARAKCGTTALHFAAEQGYLHIVSYLVETGGADVDVIDSHGMTPILGAADHCRAQVVEYLLPRMPMTKDREYKKKQIDVLELLGASFANSFCNYSMEKSYLYLEKAMKLRWEDPDDPILKPETCLTKCIAAYNFHSECCCIEDLEGTRNDADKLHMEGLVIRERILGPGSMELTTPIIYRGAVFADDGNFDRCIPLWIHALNLKSNMKTRLDKEILQFTQLFCQVLECGKSISYEDFIVVFSTAKEGLTSMVDFTAGNCCQIRDKASRERAELMSKDCGKEDCVQFLMMLFLYLTVIFTKIKKDFSPEHCHHIMSIIHDVINKVNPKTKNNRTLLHLVVDSETPVDHFHTNNFVRFPCSVTTKILLEVGADPRAVDDEYNTPLHIIVGYQKIVSDFQTLHTIVAALVAAGAHCDVLNIHGQTPIVKAATGVAQIILKIQEKINLKCLCARAVKRHEIKYKGIIPKDLEQFVNMHGP